MSDYHLDWNLLTGLVGLLVGAASGLLVPWLVRRVPEPEDAEPDKVRYNEIAASRALRPGAVLVGAVLLGAMAATLGWRWALVPLALWVPMGVALAVIDWSTLRLPTYYLAPMYPASVVVLGGCAALDRDLDAAVRVVAGWLVVGGFYFVLNLLGPRMVGYGDVRLAGLLGPVLGLIGWAELVVGLVLPFLGFGLVGLCLVIWHRDRAQLKRRLPFGPAMLGGAAVAVVAGGPLALWYLGTAGF